jgi:DNA sulfur modification protein DndB
MKARPGDGTGGWVAIPVIRGRCGQLPVVLGVAPARDLVCVSFSDVLDEARQTGYQRPCDPRHAQEFHDYIHQPDATTIPLTFNLRGDPGQAWRLDPSDAAEGEPATLLLRLPLSESDRVVARVDCQHRLEMMTDSSVPLTFQCFLGLSPRQEMAIFHVINSKAKGLNPSLIDYHTTLLQEIAEEHPHLFIAKRLHDDPESVWHSRLKLGGAATQGTHRRVSLRGMRHAVALFLQSALVRGVPVREQYRMISAFWTAVVRVWPEAWNQPRRHLLTKGIGVQGLSLLAGDIVKLAMSADEALDASTFERYLRRIRTQNWTNTGPFKGLGGRSGAQEVHERLARQLLLSTRELMRQVG